MVEVKKQVRFNEINTVYRNVRVGQIPIHPDDTVMQEYGPSKSVQFLVRDVAPNGTLYLYETPHFEITFINPGAFLNAVYCPHPESL